MDTPTREELAWCGGLFEGEGTITGTATAHAPFARVSMSDRDDIERFAACFSFGGVSRIDGAKPGYKAMWTWSTGGFPHVQALVAMLWPWLGVRRKAKAKEVLARFAGGRGHARGRQACPQGHPYTPENTYLWPRANTEGRHHRQCRTCMRARSLARRR